jgi:YHS domain-containing protein
MKKQILWMPLALCVLAGAVMADPYPLDTCPISGAKLGKMGDPIVKEMNGQEVRFCCKACIAAYEKDPEKARAKIDAAIVARQKPHYPLDTCVVLGGKLGAMGDPVEHVHKNRLVRFCCAGCTSKFNKDPAKFLSKLDEAAKKAQRKSYPLDTCLVTGEKLGGKPLEIVVAGRLFRLCCKGCVKAVGKDPAKHLALLDKARKGEKVEAAGSDHK